MNALIELFGDAQQALFERLLQPLMFHLGLGNLLADLAYVWVDPRVSLGNDAP